MQNVADAEVAKKLAAAITSVPKLTVELSDVVRTLQLRPHGCTEGLDEPEQDDREGVKRSGDVGRGAAEARALQQSCPRHPGRRPTARHGARGRCRKGEHRRGQ
jgi:hypothetical protein